METRGQEKNYAYLNQLSTKELENMLRADFNAPDGGDSELALAIMEVIVEREEQDEDARRAETERAWAEFQTYYNTPEGREHPLYPSDDCESGRETPDAVPPLAFPRRRRTPRRILIAVALIALLIAASLIPVQGYDNVLQMVAYWTADQFSFRAAGAYVEPQEEEWEYLQLKETLKEYGIDQPVLPKIPEGFSFSATKIVGHSESEENLLGVIYTRDEDYIIVNIDKNEKQSDLRHEKDLGTVKIYSVGTIDHYIFSNNGRVTVAWYVKDLECSMYTELSVSEVEEIINSIYKE